MDESLLNNLWKRVKGYFYTIIGLFGILVILLIILVITNFKILHKQGSIPIN
jgi:hypothetical protein